MTRGINTSKMNSFSSHENPIQKWFSWPKLPLKPVTCSALEQLLNYFLKYKLDQKYFTKPLTFTDHQPRI